MRSLVLLSALLLVLSVLPVHGSFNGVKTEREYQASFSHYIRQYNKHYTTSAFYSHYLTYKRNLDTINAHNQLSNTTFRMGINAFTDMESADVAATYNGWRPAKLDMDTSERVKVQLPAGGVPTSLDWRTKGAVTAVKDQGQSPVVSYCCTDTLHTSLCVRADRLLACCWAV